ncbi:hypothetical protein [Caldisalinibacter kiritimatiensis]|uniref:Uncharacterized protein n=1 Tax=Caldisalinibacter kiritimatiensis TaxID=1304284 RepID=R1CM54_9FIRM|nr:hypothetical protein [Caldisalinibacter kiritimatiensis]EOC99790.1 hypothetical protein L21TH_2169 [Caldisalinibacter kiritimatiensis]
MDILKITDYKVVLAERICYNKFDNDVMLIFNNFSSKAISSIVDIIKDDIKEIENKGVIFDYKLLNVFCTMYLGLAWSMYRKGKTLQKQEKVINSQIKSKCRDDLLKGIINRIYKESDSLKVINDIATRYYTLYMDKYVNDMLMRMEVCYHPDIDNEEELKFLILDKLNQFAIKTLALGINDEYIKCDN